MKNRINIQNNDIRIALQRLSQNKNDRRKKLDDFSLLEHPDVKSLYSDSFKVFLTKEFKGKNLSLLRDWLQNIKLKSTTVSIEHWTINKKTINQFDPTISEGTVLCLKINLADWDKKDFEELLRKIADKPIYHLTLEGRPHASCSDDVLKQFISQLPNVMFVDRLAQDYPLLALKPDDRKKIEKKIEEKKNVERKSSQRKIKLKRLLNPPKFLHDRKHPLPDDDLPMPAIQHEVIQEQEQEQEEEQSQEQQMQQIAQKIEKKSEYGDGDIYEGELIDWQKFKSAPYFAKIAEALWPRSPHDFYQALQAELGGFFPLSPDAAMAIATNPLDFATFNLSELPEFFVRRRSRTGAWVTDYDKTAEHKATVFTPKARTIGPDLTKLDYSRYSSDKKECLQRFLKNTELSDYAIADIVPAFEEFWSRLEKMCKAKNIDIKKINANWHTPRYGSPVVFMQRLLTILENPRDLAEQLTCLDGLVLNHYGAYHAVKYEGYQVVSEEMRLDHTATYPHQSTFDSATPFYRVELETILQYLPADADDDKSETKSSHPSKRQGPLYLEQFLPLIFRFIGQQTSGISVKEYASSITKNTMADEELFSLFSSASIGKLMELMKVGQLKHLLRYLSFSAEHLLLSHSLTGKAKQQHIHFNNVLNYAVFLPLFFLAHEGHQPKTPADSLIKLFFKYGMDEGHLNENIVNDLLFLYKSGSYLNNAEAEKLLSNLTATRTAGVDKDKFMERRQQAKKLFAHLKYNKYGMVRLLHAMDSKLLLSEGVGVQFDITLLVEECLADETAVRAVYQDDLLLFAGFLSHNFIDPTLLLSRIKNDPSLIKIRDYLKKAAGEQPNNLDDAFKLILKELLNPEYFELAEMVALFQRVDSLKSYQPALIAEMILSLLQQKIGVSFVKQTIPPISHDRSRIKSLIIRILSHPDSKPPLRGTKYPTITLMKLDVAELTDLLEKYTLEAGTLKVLLKKLQSAMIDNEIFKHPMARDLLRDIAEIKDFSESKEITLDKIKFNVKQVTALISLIKKITTKTKFIKNKEKIITAFGYINFAKLDYALFFRFLKFLDEFQQDYTAIVSEFAEATRSLEKTEHIDFLLLRIEELNRNHCRADHIVQFIKLYYRYSSGCKDEEFIPTMEKLSTLFLRNPKSQLLTFLLQSYLSFKALKSLVDLIPLNFDDTDQMMSQLLKGIAVSGREKLNGFLEEFSEYKPPDKDHVFAILYQAYAHTSADLIDGAQLDFTALAKMLLNLPSATLQALYQKYQQAPLNIITLQGLLPNNNDQKWDDDFFARLEKAPFGERPLAAQFDISNIERTINACRDLDNHDEKKSPTHFTWEYKKKLMESFLFVNEAGRSLPLYLGKPAKDLSNEEIKKFFQDIRAGKFAYLDTFKQGLFVLALMREALYRTTNKFLYSTQMIALIDTLMRGGNVISNIDTGQGKTWIDAMKAALLYSRNDMAGVDMCTSFLDDAERDIGLCGPFFALLGIPYTERPISATSDASEYKVNGINYSTFPNLALFRSRAVLENKPLLLPPGKKIGVVINESDLAVLDDVTIYRLAVPIPGTGKPWLYECILEFIDLPIFKKDDLSEEEDVANLRGYLENYAKTNHLPIAIVDQLSNAQLLKYIESALLVVYKLKKDEDFVVVADEKTTDDQRPATIKLLSAEGEIIPGANYGNGVDQLLKVHLNKSPDYKWYRWKFDIKPESKTIISTNNKNLIDFYKKHNGIIWGSSGTVGSAMEIEDQKKYDFIFSKVEPHQPRNMVVIEDSNPSANKEHWGKKIHSALNDLIQNGGYTVVVFFKNIKELNQFVEKYYPNDDYSTKSAALARSNIQVFTGIGDRAQAIAQFKQGKHTLTTSVLGRNANLVPHDKSKTVAVFQTFPDSPRGTGQKGGRSGRNGLPGLLRFLFNKEDYGQYDSVEAFQAGCDLRLKARRDYNEGLYDFLNELLCFILALKNEEFTKVSKVEFIKQVWSSFSGKAEALYQKQKSNGLYNALRFRENRIKKFNDLLKEYTTRPFDEKLSATTGPHITYVQYTPAEKPVQIADCMPPEAMAYQFLNVTDADVECKGEQKNAQTVNDQLKQLFLALKNGATPACMNDYYAFLDQRRFSLTVFATAHQDFIKSYLREQIDTAANQAWFFQHRWQKSDLMKTAANKNTLLMFSALLRFQNNKPLVEINLLIEMVVMLLQEYRQRNWRIHGSREREVDELIPKIRDSKDANQLMGLLSESSSTVLEHDIETNKSYLRKIKPLNRNSTSRWQKTLSLTANLVSALTGVAKHESVVVSAEKQLKSIVGAQDLSKFSVFKEKPTKDNFLHLVGSLKTAPVADRNNMDLVLDRLEETLRFS